MKIFNIIANMQKDTDHSVADGIAEYLVSKGCVCKESGYDISSETEACIVLGGDGTIIKAVNNMNRDIPIMGINLGHLGFMSSVEKSDIFKALDALISDEFTVEKRMMTDVTVTDDDRVFTTLNDAVVNRRGFSQMIATDIYVNDSKVKTLFGDGVIVSTPTGSTGYNLSAGGPVVTPEAELMVISPICPHSLTARSVVVSSNDEVRIVLNLSRSKKDDKATLTLDGQIALELPDKAEVTVRKSSRVARLIRLKDSSFFEILYRKLGAD